MMSTSSKVDINLASTHLFKHIWSKPIPVLQLNDLVFDLQHLLCLLLQALASIALNPHYHQALNDADISDMLMQLLLPSDEWYYTNHSTKYAKYIKYHAARILVYMGLLHKLGGRVDLFDRKCKYILYRYAQVYVKTVV